MPCWRLDVSTYIASSDRGDWASPGNFPLVGESGTNAVDAGLGL